MSSVSQFFGGRIKSIQRGVITITSPSYTGVQDVTIIAVDTTKSILYHLGSPAGIVRINLSDEINNAVMLTLQNSTTIRATYGSSVRREQGLQAVSWQLVEYF